MSASTEKKNRQAAREAGTDKKTLAAQEEAKKQAVSRKRWMWTGIGIAVLIVLIFILNSTVLYTKTTAVTVDGRNYSPSELTYTYATQYQNFVSTYGSYASMFGLNTSYGLSGLSSQECSMTDGGTWRDYFMDSAINALKQNQALEKYAKDNGIELTDEEKQQVDDSIAEIKEAASNYGYANGDKFIAANYGVGNNLKTAKAYATEYALASKVYTQLC